jgi:hypothetical protein
MFRSRAGGPWLVIRVKRSRKFVDGRFRHRPRAPIHRLIKRHKPFAERRQFGAAAPSTRKGDEYRRLERSVQRIDH